MSVGGAVGGGAAGNPATQGVGRMFGGAILGLAVTVAATQFQEEIRSFKNYRLIDSYRGGWISKETLGEDLYYIIKFEEDFALKQATIPEQRKLALFTLMTHYTRLLNEAQQSQYLSNFRQGIELLFDLPTGFCNPVSEESLQSLKTQIQHDYPEISSQIINFIDQLEQYITDSENNPKPNPLLLLGEPGVGKTRLMEEVISKKLNIPVHRISLANLTQAELNGDENVNLCNQYNEGVLIKGLVEAARKNRGRAPVIIFFDDICAAFTKDVAKEVKEQEILTWLTTVLDPERRTIPSKMYNRYSTNNHRINNIDIELDKFIFVAAANSTHFVLTQGMEDRLRSKITFPPISTDKKKEIAKTYSRQLEQRALASIRNKNQNRKSQAEIKATINKEDAAAVEEIARLDTFPGARTLKSTIDKWYTAKKAGTPFDIKAHYDRLNQDARSLHQNTAPPPQILPAFQQRRDEDDGLRRRTVDAQPTDSSDQVDMVTQLIAKKLNLGDNREENIRKLQALVQAGILDQSDIDKLKSTSSKNKFG